MSPFVVLLIERYLDCLLALYRPWQRFGHVSLLAPGAIIAANQKELIHVKPFSLFFI